MIESRRGDTLWRLDGAKLSGLRKTRQLSLRQAALRLGVTHQALDRWEHEFAIPRDLSRLVAVFGEGPLTDSGALVSTVLP